MNLLDRAAYRLAAMLALGAIFVASKSAQADAALDRPASPAVVNPVFRSDLRAVLSLNGKWEFATDPKAAGDQEKWFDPSHALQNEIEIQVPGCWEAQGVGGQGNSQPQAVETSVRPLRGSYRGTAWYRKTVSIPQNWTGSQLSLAIGGVNTQGWFWVNGQYLGHLDHYCGTFKYDITDAVTPGKDAVVVAKVRNDVPSSKGLMNWVDRFGGLYRDVEIQATAPTSIDYAYVQGDLDQARAVAHLTLRNAGTQAVQAELVIRASALSGPHSTVTDRIAGESKVACTINPGRQDIVLPVKLDLLNAWSPEHPHLYRADMELRVAGKAVDGWAERFGLRKWEVRGNQFFLNNKPYFVRGYGDDYIYPLTLCSPASRDIHRQHLAIAHAYGFGYVRHHTHCELPEFYEAADENGIMVQPELPFYGTSPSNAGAPNHPEADLEELITHYRRYTSLSTYCMGNEGEMGKTGVVLYQLAKKLDPTRLVIDQDGGANRVDNSDYGSGPVAPWPPAKLNPNQRPFIAHEYLNLALDEDPRLEKQYTGALLPPVRMADFENVMKQLGIDPDLGLATFDGGSQLQKIYQKQGLEMARRDPNCGGYIYWTLVDVGSPAANGMLNQFWEPKVSTPDFIHRFNQPVVLLSNLIEQSPVWSAEETRDIKLSLSNFGDEPITGAQLAWKLTAAGQLLACGAIDNVSAKIGAVVALDPVQVKAPMAVKPVQAIFEAELKGTPYRNSWNVWVIPNAKPEDGKGMCATKEVFSIISKQFPGMTQSDTPANSDAMIVVTDQLNQETLDSLKAGKRVLLLSLAGIRPGVQLGWWGKSNQTGTAISKNAAAFGDYPNNGYLDQGWFDLVGGAAPMIDSHYAFLQPAEKLMLGRGASGYLLYAFQARAGKGQLMGTGLSLVANTAQSRYLLSQIVHYIRSDAFAPKAAIEWIKLEEFSRFLSQRDSHPSK